jgi:hypothetical protein
MKAKLKGNTPTFDTNIFTVILHISNKTNGPIPQRVSDVHHRLNFPHQLREQNHIINQY